MKHSFWKNKVILVTGASSGIGQAVVELLAKEECTVFAVARTIKAKKGKSIANVIPVVCDITKESDLKKLVKTVSQVTDRLDILVNNAGITAHGRMDQTSMDVFRRVFDINFFGTVSTTLHLLDLLKKARGTVVTVSTVSGFYGIPGRVAYASSKAALHSVFETFSIEMKSFGVGSLVLCPPYTKTSLRTSGLTAGGQPLQEEQHKGRLLLPGDVAKHMLTSIEKKRRGILPMDATGRFVKWMRTLAPGILEKVLYKKLYKDFK